MSTINIVKLIIAAFLLVYGIYRERQSQQNGDLFDSILNRELTLAGLIVICSAG